MPNAHNGYYDRELEMGYVGLAFLYVIIAATLQPVGRVADQRPGAGAAPAVACSLFFITLNYFESLRMRGFESLWIVFPITAAEIGRYWQSFPLRQPFPLKKAAYQPVEVRLR
jgi:O-antigen ligase